MRFRESLRKREREEEKEREIKRKRERIITQIDIHEKRTRIGIYELLPSILLHKSEQLIEILRI